MIESLDSMIESLDSVLEQRPARLGQGRTARSHTCSGPA
jgi:hypothetical protein